MKPRGLLLFLFFVSGGCGLIYEVVWTRLFIIVIGNTVFSVSAVLTAFMAGLAFGSRISGRLLDRRSIPLIRSYALLEIGIGAYNLLIPLLLKAADPIFGALYATAYDSFFILALARLFIVFLLLIVPAALMGATLPILIRFYVENVASVGSEAGRVYTANTWGAAFGTAAAGFLLIPAIGVLYTLVLAAILNFTIAGIAFYAASAYDRPSLIARSPASDAPERVAAGPPIVLVAALLSGFAALMNEVAWTRVLGLVVGPTTYAFTLMLVSMVAGLGLGAAAGAYWMRRRDPSIAAFAWIEIGVGVTALALIPAFGRLPIWIGRLVTRYVESFAAIQISEFLIFFGLLLVPTTLLGMTFPIASRLYAKSNSLLGTEVSAVYASNTVGGILGSLAAGFFLIPHIGSQWTLVVASAVSLCAGLVLVMRPAQFVVAAAALVAAFFSPRWDPELMSSGAYKYAPYFASNIDLESVLTGGDLLYYREGATTTVSAKKFRGDVMLAIDGKVDATDSGDMTTQKMLAHLPLLLSKDARNVAVIGLGSGVTAGAALRHPIESLDVIELSPEVVAASRFFNHVNHNALADPRTRLIVGDGRNHLRYIKKRYDVTISEPSNPWMSGMASLFSREFFSEVLAKLNPKGIHCQWFHSYNMSESDLQTVIATFRSVFPHSQLWALNENDLLLLGSPARIAIDEPAMTASFERVAEDLRLVQIHDLYTVLSLYMLEDEDLDRFASGADLNTDNRPVLEFRAPRFIYANTAEENYVALLAIERQVNPPEFLRRVVANATFENHRNRGNMYLAAESFKSAAAEFEHAIEKNVEDERAWRGLIEAARNTVDRAKLRNFVETTLAKHPVPLVRLAASDFLAQEGATEKAIVPLLALLEEDPKHLGALEKLTDIYGAQGSAKLPEIIDRLRLLDPQNNKAMFHLATVRLYQGIPDEAIQLISGVLEREPAHTRARNLLAVAYSQTFQPGRAEAEFRNALVAAPEDWVSFNNYGLFLMERGRHDEAIRQFREALNINPNDVQAYVGIAETYRQTGQAKIAQSWYRKALRLDPNQPIAKMYAQ